MPYKCFGRRAYLNLPRIAPSKKEEKTEGGEAMRFAKISRRLTLTLYFGQFHFPDSLTRFTEAERKYISVRDVTNVDREMNARNMRYEYRGQEIKQNCKSWNNRLPFYISDLLRPTFDVITDGTSFLNSTIIRQLFEIIGGGGES